MAQRHRVGAHRRDCRRVFEERQQGLHRGQPAERIPGMTKTSGQKKYMTEIIVNDRAMLTGKGEGAGGGEYSGGSRGASSGGGGNNFDQRTPEPEPAPAGLITDDDIPF